MKRDVLKIIVVCIFFVLPFSSEAQTTSQISQFGITWTFDWAYQYGQFANGDYWVVGPVNIINIDPASVETGGRTINGSMINPSPRNGTRQGYDSQMDGASYDAGLNAARPNGSAVSSSNLLIIQPGSTLVSTISTPDAGGRTQLQSAAVLTVLSQPAPPGSFRPPYVNVSKEIRYNKDQLDYSVLGRLNAVASVPRLKQRAGDSQGDSVERMFERPWLDHLPAWPCRSQHPVENMQEYDGFIARQVGEGGLMLNLDLSNAEKETLLIRYVQLGIDWYGVITDGGEKNFRQDNGRKLPITLAARVLNDSEMLTVFESTGDYLNTAPYGAGNPPPDLIIFEEDSETFYISQYEVDISHSPEWHPDERDAVHLPYENEHIGIPEWGPRKGLDVNSDTSNLWWGMGYRLCCNGTNWAGIALTAHAVGVHTLWNHNAFFDYLDRYMWITSDEGPEPGSRQSSRFAEDMWDAHRSNFGCTWTLDNPANPYCQGHYQCAGAAVRCSQISSCNNYPNQRARDYDPCRLGCGGSPPQILYGDVSENGSISAYDASLTAQSAVDLIDLTPSQTTKADVTGNGSVSASDASWIARKVVDPNLVFPVEE